MPKTYQDGIIDRVISRRVCARCYGDLVKTMADDRTWGLICPKCGDTWHGATVSRRYAERLGQQAMNEYLEVRHNPALRDVLGIERSSEAEIMKDLGF